MFECVTVFAFSVSFLCVYMSEQNNTQINVSLKFFLLRFLHLTPVRHFLVISFTSMHFEYFECYIFHAFSHPRSSSLYSFYNIYFMVRQSLCQCGPTLLFCECVCVCLSLKIHKNKSDSFCFCYLQSCTCIRRLQAFIAVALSLA